MEHWTEKFFVKKGDLWLHLMNERWKHARKNTRAIAKILKKFGVHKGKVLELSCGNGRISINLSRRGFDVTGVDISPLYINDARRRAKRNVVNAHFICGDIKKIDKIVGKKFDAVLSVWTSIGYYNKRTDERIFKKVCTLLKRKGIFLILNTMSRDFLANHYCSGRYDETKDVVILHKDNFSLSRAGYTDKWTFYKREYKDLKYITEFDIKLRVYSMHELVEMAEKASLEFVEAYDALSTLAPARLDSTINMVFRKK